MSEVLIAGRGLAALTCALLLVRQGRCVRILGAETTGTRWLVLPEAVTGLLREVWGTDAGGLDDAWQLERRRVRWGDTTQQDVTAPSRALDGVVLNQRLTAHLAATHADRVHFDHTVPLGSVPVPAPQTIGSSWLITAAPAPSAARFCTVGRRRIITAEVILTPACDPSTCIVETTSQGWVYLAPVARGRALVQAMVPGPVDEPRRLLVHLLEETGLGRWLAEPPACASVIQAAPGLVARPCGPNWFAVGAAAVRFDPLSGSGTAQAVRTALLAAAAIDAIDRGESAQEVCAHYAARLQMAFIEHLRSCLRLYTAMSPGAAWQDETEATAAALNASAGRMARMDFTLSGFTLQRKG